ncbi:MAG: DUF2807 domain-containing protein [Treponema sp.]|nr:DUF2807 domain-containing protein [Treponema sp.]
MKRERTKINGRWLALPVILVAGLTVGCVINAGTYNIRGNGNVVGQQRSLQGFDSVVLAGVGNVNIHPGEESRVVVTTDSNIQDFITTDVSGTSLRIGARKNTSFNPTRLTIDVYLPTLRSISLQGVGNFTVGAGEASFLELILDGVGDIDAQNFEAGSVNVNLSGVGDIRAWATNTLTGNLSGVGNVRFRGNPSTNTVNRSGVGQVRPL